MDEHSGCNTEDCSSPSPKKIRSQLIEAPGEMEYEDSKTKLPKSDEVGVAHSPPRGEVHLAEGYLKAPGEIQNRAGDSKSEPPLIKGDGGRHHSLSDEAFTVVEDGLQVLAENNVDLKVGSLSLKEGSADHPVSDTEVPLAKDSLQETEVSESRSQNSEDAAEVPGEKNNDATKSESPECEKDAVGVHSIPDAAVPSAEVENEVSKAEAQHSRKGTAEDHSPPCVPETVDSFHVPGEKDNEDLTSGSPQCEETGVGDPSSPNAAVSVVEDDVIDSIEMKKEASNTESQNLEEVEAKDNSSSDSVVPTTEIASDETSNIQTETGSPNLETTESDDGFLKDATLDHVPGLREEGEMLCSEAEETSEQAPKQGLGDSVTNSLDKLTSAINIFPSGSLTSVEGPSAQNQDLDDLLLDSKILSKISPTVAPYWKELGRELGLKEEVLDALEADVANEMLELWKDKPSQTKQATRKNLLDQIRKVAPDSLDKVVEQLASCTDSSTTSDSVTKTLDHRRSPQQINQVTTGKLNDESGICSVVYSLRCDQTVDQISKCGDANVYVCGPLWVKEGIEKLQPLLEKIDHLSVRGAPKYLGILAQPQCELVLLSKFDELVKLQLLSRNESSNVTGIISKKSYNCELDESFFISLKDLVRQTVIVGDAITTHYGGYRTKPKYQSADVLICDMAALQFQKEYNSGRLVLVREKPLPAGILDHLIYEKTVGESKMSFHDACAEKDRFIEVNSQAFGRVLFDTVAYIRFVAQDVVLAGLALNKVAEKKGHILNFKFLKYGTGFFAGAFGKVLDEYILQGVLLGLQKLFRYHRPACIRTVELPFYVNTKEDQVREVESEFKITIRFSSDDALKAPGDKNLTTGTTNCADPHAVFGNEMGYSSVDAAIAQNLKDKGKKFCPLMNQEMNQAYLDIH